MVSQSFGQDQPSEPLVERGRPAESAVPGHTRLGFIGLGVMGRPMAHRVLERGFTLTVHSRTRARAATLEAGGATWAETPRAVAAASDVVVTMLPDSPDVEEVLLGKDGVLAGARAGLVWIDTSTISPTATRSLVEVAAARRVPSLDAPVTGGEAAAQRGTLTIMVGGAAEQVARSRPILDAFGSKIVHVGGAGAGQVAKACNQVLVGGTIALVAEALLLAAKSGVDPALVREALLGGFAQSRVLEVHGERMLAGQYVPGFRVRLHQKDLGIVAELARAVGLPVVLTAAATQIMNGLTPEERDLDHSALALVYERMAGTALRPSTQGEVA